MEKKIIRLTEQDIHAIVKESVGRILKEQDIDNDSYYGGGLPDSSYNDPGFEEPNEVEDFEGTPAWNAINSVMDRYGINDVNFDEIMPMIKPIAQKLQILDRAMEEATREIYSNGDGRTNTVNHEDVINYMRETMPNYVNLLFKVRHLWQYFGWLAGRK